jgi:MFS family permease
MAGTDYSWVASALYIGWLVSSYPSNLLLQRFPIGKFIGIMLFIWGVICMLQSTVFNFSGFFAIRFFLGAVEACVSPAWILLTGRLWTHEEQTFRTSLWLAMNGMSSIIGALLAYGLGHADGLALANWKLIFIVVGGMTIIWGFVIISYMPDGPHNGPMFSHYENVVLVWRVSSNKTGVAHSKFEPRQAKEAFLDIKTWLLVSTGACYGILNGGVANFISTLIKGFGFDALQSSLMQTPGGAFEIVGCVFFGWLSTKKNMTGIVICIACLPGMAGLIGIRVLPTEGYRYNLAACAWLQNIIGCPLILNWTLPSLNVSGHTKRTTAMGLYFL